MIDQNFIFEDHDLVLQGLPIFDQSLMCTNILHNYYNGHVDKLKSTNYIIYLSVFFCILICLVRNGSPCSITD